MNSNFYLETPDEKELKFEQIFETENDQFELDMDLNELRRKYFEIKKDRQKNEKDALCLENKMKLLFIEEQRANKREERENKTREEIERIRKNIQLEKKNLFESKLLKEKQILEKKEQIFKMREKIQTGLRIGTGNLIKKKNQDLTQMKKLKQEYNTIVEIKKIHTVQKNQRSAWSIKNDKQAADQKKKKDEIEKKLSQKRDLENKILEEELRRIQLENNINNFQLEERIFIKRRTKSCTDYAYPSPTPTKTISTLSTLSSKKVASFHLV